METSDEVILGLTLSGDIFYIVLICSDIYYSLNNV